MIRDADQSFKWFGIRRTAKRFDRVAFQLGRARQSSGPSSVHDLRVSIRRLLAALDVFGKLFPKKDCRALTAALETVFKLAGEVRDRDIALELAAEAGLERDSPVVRAFARQRRGLAANLREELRRGRNRKFSIRRRGRLGLNS